MREELVDAIESSRTREIGEGLGGRWEDAIRFSISGAMMKCGKETPFSQ